MNSPYPLVILSVFTLIIATYVFAWFVWFLAKVDHEFRRSSSPAGGSLGGPAIAAARPNEPAAPASSLTTGALVDPAATSADAMPEQAATPPVPSGKGVILRRCASWIGRMLGLWLALFGLLCLFTANIRHDNMVELAEGWILAWGFVGTLVVSLVSQCVLLRRLEAPLSVRTLGMAPFKEAAAITGIIFALFAGKVAVLSLTKSTNSNLATVNGQIYQNDRAVGEKESAVPRLLRLYIQEDFMPAGATGEVRPLTAEDFAAPGTVAEAYWQHRLRHYTAPSAAVRGPTAANAGEPLPGDIEPLTLMLESSTDNDSPNEQLGRAFAHVTNILNNMHLVYDYASRRVIPKGDTEAWLGYFEDYGPHPVVLAAIWNWLERGYMTHEFYAVAEYRLSGKLELFALLKRFPQNADALLLAQELSDQAVIPDKSGQSFRPLQDSNADPKTGFYLRMAQYVHEHAADAVEEKKLYRALAKAAVYDRFMIARSKYKEYVDDLVPDYTENGPETVADLPPEMRRGRAKDATP